MNKEYFSARNLEKITKVKIPKLENTKLKMVNKLNLKIKQDF